MKERLEKGKDGLVFLPQAQGVVISQIGSLPLGLLVRFGIKHPKYPLFATLHLDDPAFLNLEVDVENAELGRMYQGKLLRNLLTSQLIRLFPLPVRIPLTLMRAAKRVSSGVRSLLKGQMTVDVLDAAAITTSILRKDYATASSIMMLLGIGELLEEWTMKKSLHDLASSLRLDVDEVWVVDEDGAETRKPLKDVSEGEHVKVYQGNVIGLDGLVTEGEAMVNQSVLTGESLPVHKKKGSPVSAGTVVDEGVLVFTVISASGEGRYDKIVHMIEESHKLETEATGRAVHLADQLVPFSLIGSGLAYLITRNADRALSPLMVDFSCALRLAMPLSLLAAMNEASKNGILIKDGRALENTAKADTIVFDKTGTLTRAKPEVVDVLAFNGHEKDEVLTVAACLEEHFPHSMAKAVVTAAEEEGLTHKEMHQEVEYLMAHGIVSRIGDERVVIGSPQFVFEDEKVGLSEEARQAVDALPDEASRLFLAIGGKLGGILLIEDPLRPEASRVLNELRKAGLSHLVMMTRDASRAAASVADELGIEEFQAEVLPEDKANFVIREKEKGRTVLMVGDGVNDAPALSMADTGIAIQEGVPVAREIADITLYSDSIETLSLLKILSDRLERRLQNNYRLIMGFNGLLIAAGVLGLVAPASSALYHNISTLLIAAKSLTPLL